MFPTIEIAPISYRGNTNDTIISPTIEAFAVAVALKFKETHGVRRLISFIERCQGRGPWGETIKRRQKHGDSSKQFTYSKYELELHELQTIIQKALKSGFEIDHTKTKRLDELNKLMSPSLANKTDEELEHLFSDLIKKGLVRA